MIELPCPRCCALRKSCRQTFNVYSKGTYNLEPETLNIVVIGMGYVGIPCAALLADVEGFNVIGVQRCSERSGWKIAHLNAGKSPFEGDEPGLAELIHRVAVEKGSGGARERRSRGGARSQGSRGTEAQRSRGAEGRGSPSAVLRQAQDIAISLSGRRVGQRGSSSTSRTPPRASFLRLRSGQGWRRSGTMRAIRSTWVCGDGDQHQRPDASDCPADGV